MDNHGDAPGRPARTQDDRGSRSGPPHDLDELIEREVGPTMTNAYYLPLFRAVAEAALMAAPIIDRKHCEKIARRELARELLLDIDEAVLTMGPEQGVRLFKTHLREIAEEGE